MDTSVSKFRDPHPDPNRATVFTYTVVHIHAFTKYNLIVHSDLEPRTALTIATEYIVVFKKTASKEEVQKWKDEIVKNNGQVTHEYGTVLNGFAAEIAPETFQSLTNAATDDGPIAYIEPDGVMTTQ